MNLIKKIWENVLKILGFTNYNVNSIQENSNFEERYRDISDVNMTAILSSKLAVLTLVDSEINVDGNNARANYLNESFIDLWKKKSKKIVNLMLGNGGLFIFPRITNGKLYFDLITQDRVSINKAMGDLIVSATMLAEIKKVKNKRYYRWVSYNLDVNDKSIAIENLVTDESGAATSVDFWNDLQNFYITGVQKPLFAFFKSPKDNRNVDDMYGVPITYGASKTIERINETLKQIDIEFKNKEVKIFADERLFKKDSDGNYCITDKFFKLVRGSAGNQELMTIFSPDIRESSYYTKLENLMKMLENESGVSAGVITKAETRGATATEIKANNVDTYSTIGDIRNVIESGFNDLKYACDVLLNYFNVITQGESELKFNWSYLLVEDSQEAFDQLVQARNLGVISKEEVRQWIYPNETLEESINKINEIKDDIVL